LISIRPKPNLLPLPTATRPVLTNLVLSFLRRPHALFLLGLVFHLALDLVHLFHVSTTLQQHPKSFDTPLKLHIVRTLYHFFTTITLKRALSLSLSFSFTCLSFCFSSARVLFDLSDQRSSFRLIRTNHHSTVFLVLVFPLHHIFLSTFFKSSCSLRGPTLVRLYLAACRKCRYSIASLLGSP
jgi:hypothetical protein